MCVEGLYKGDKGRKNSFRLESEEQRNFDLIFYSSIFEIFLIYIFIRKIYQYIFNKCIFICKLYIYINVLIYYKVYIKMIKNDVIKFISFNIFFLYSKELCVFFEVFVFSFYILLFQSIS